MVLLHYVMTRFQLIVPVPFVSESGKKGAPHLTL